MDNNVEGVRRTLENSNIDINTAARYDGVPLYVATRFDTSSIQNIKIIELLLQHPDIDVNKTSVMGRTPLHGAIVTNNTEAVRLLVQHPNIDVNSPDIDGDTPYMRQ